MKLQLDPGCFRFVPAGPFLREVGYGELRVMWQYFNDAEDLSERQRAIDGATSLLEFQWARASQHERLALLAALRGSRHGREPLPEAEVED